MKPELNLFSDIHENDARERVYRIMPDVMAVFLGTFDDRNPIHRNSSYAKARGFPGCVAHGGILPSF